MTDSPADIAPRGHSRVLMAIFALVAIAAGAVVGFNIPRHTDSIDRTPDPNAADGARTPVLMPASLEASEPLVHFDDALPNQVRTRTITLTNTGETEVGIFDITSSCGCLTVDLSNRTIAPGEWIEVTPRLEVPATQNTPVRFRIDLQLSNNLEPFTLHVTADVGEVFSLEPITQGGVEAGVRVAALDGSEFSIAQLPFFFQRAGDDDANPEAETAASFDLLYAPVAEIEQGRSASPAGLELRHPAHGLVTVAWDDPLSIPGRGVPAMRPRGNDIIVSASQIKAGHDVEVVIEGPTPADLDRLSADVSGMDGVEVALTQIESVPEGAMLHLHLSGNPDPWRGGVFVFRCDNEPGATMRIIAGAD